MLQFVKGINSFLWDYFLIIVLLGTGIFFTIKLRFIQIFKFKEALNLVFGQFKLGAKVKKEGEMTPFQALATSIGAQVGTGNLTGASTALIMGGPGAIFWMWLSAFFGMATIYAEATLAQKYKQNIDGEITGGPVYYIKQAFKGKFGKILACLFAIFIILALGFMGIMVQSNSIGSAFSEVFNERGIKLNTIFIGIFVAFFSFIIFLGGTKRLANIIEKIVPIMAFIYIIGSLILIVFNIDKVPQAFKMIILGAFKPNAVLGGIFGITIREAIRYGVARGLFSNEAGMGSTPNAHARANAKNPHEQGLVAMVSVFIDTFIILNLTVFSVLTTNSLSSGKIGIALTQFAFSSTFKSFGDIFIAVCLLFFAFSTILSWHFFGAINVKYLFGQKAIKFYSLIVVFFIILGSCLEVEIVWQLADLFNGLMVIPNVLALIFLSKVVFDIYNKYKN